MVIPYYAMNEEEITILEKEIKKEKDKIMRDRIRAKCILAISSKIEKPNFLSLTCPKCHRKLKIKTFYIYYEYEYINFYYCECGYEYARLIEDYPDMYCESLQKGK